MEKNEQDSKPRQLFCPHCKKPMDQVEWRFYGEGNKVGLVGCGNCKKVIGANIAQTL